MRTLYLCYFGLGEPLVQTQVLPYLRQLARQGVGVGLLTFEPDLRSRWIEQELQTVAAELKQQGIEWHYLPYHKTPSVPATVYDILRGAWLAARLARSRSFQTFHARAHVPLAMALLAKLFVRAKLIFDLRGLMAEEYVDAGVWSNNSLPFRAVKRLEQAGLERADRIVVLTERLRDWLTAEGAAPAGAIQVIPCCVDLSGYSANSIRSERFEVAYAGSVTGLYLLEEMARFFASVRALEPRALLRILTTSPPTEAERILTRAGLDQDHFWIGRVPADQVPRYLSAARVGISFRKPTFSQIAASPTKIPEYLAAGLPVVSNSGIGDTDQLLVGNRIGVIVSEFTTEAYARAASAAIRMAHDPEVSNRCREAARKYFDLEAVGGVRYGNIYRQLDDRGNTRD